MMNLESRFTTKKQFRKRNKMKIIEKISKKQWGLIILVSFFAFFLFRYAYRELNRTYYNFHKSLDFNSVLFIESGSSDGAFAGDFGDIVIMDLGNGKKYYLNSDSDFDYNPVLSSDRKGVFFYSKRTGDGFAQKMAGAGGPSELCYLSLIDRSIKILPVLSNRSDFKSFGIINCLTSVPSDTVIIFGSSREVRIYSMKDKTVKRYWAKPKDMDFAIKVGVTPDSKYFYMNYYKKAALKVKSFITELCDTTNLLSFENYDYKDIHTIGYNSASGVFYLKYVRTDSLYHDLPLEVYKFFPTSRKLELLYRLDKDIEKGFIPEFMQDDTTIIGGIVKKTKISSRIVVVYDRVNGVMKKFDEDNTMSNTSFSYFWK